MKGLSPAGLNVQKDVSVPLRGKGRDQLVAVCYYADWIDYVSVPLRGKGRDQPVQAAIQASQLRERFRPLAGKR